MNIKKVCKYCGSDDVVKDATARWDIGAQEWSLSGVFENTSCSACGKDSNTLTLEIEAGPTLTRWSVLLLYPDYMSDEYGKETYYTFVDAASPDEAIRAAQQEAIDALGADDDHDILHDDFAPLLVLRGEQAPIDHDDGGDL